MHFGRALLGLVAAVAPGCGPGAAVDGGADAGGIDAAVDAGTDASVPATISGVVSEYGTSPFEPLGGATVEVLDAAPPLSVVSAPDGTYALSVAAGSTVWLRVELAGEASQQKPVVVPAAGATVDFALVPESGIASIGGALGIVLDPARGSVVAEFGTTDTGGGLDVVLSAAHDPSFTFGPGGFPQFADQTVAGGEPILMYPNVTAGISTATVVSPAALTCVPRAPVSDWRIDPTVFTWIDVDCTP